MTLPPTTRSRHPPTEKTTSKTTLLVTVGSTLFQNLTDLILSTSFLNILILSEITDLVVQYGKASITIPPASQDVQKNSEGYCSFTYPGSAKVSVSVRLLRYTDDFQGIVNDSDYVISHAGSGSILTILRTPRPLLVVPNTGLMDNHQSELADALDEQEYLTVSTLNDLIDNLPSFIGGDMKKEFPKLDGQKFRSVLDQTAGYI